jgi:hypothetical protein
MLGNAEYVKLLKQKPQDRMQIAEILEISDSQIEYVNNSDKGCGLIIWGGAIIPFKTKIPDKSSILKLWGTWRQMHGNSKSLKPMRCGFMEK